MKSAVSVPAVGIEAEPKQTLRSQLAEYVSQQPASKQTFHKWMGILEVASLAIPVGVFAIALYLSFRWTVVPTNAIPVAWFCVPLSFTPFLILVGLHAIVLQAFPPNSLMGKTLGVYPPPAGQLGKKLQFRVGRQAVLWGWGLIVTALIAAVFWGAFVWAVWSVDMTMISALVQVLGVLLTVGIVVSIAMSVFQKLSRS